MDIETAKTLKPGMRVRVTAIPAPGTTPFDGWFFKPGEEAVLLELDSTDEYADWYAKFDNGCNWFLELRHGVDYEVLDGES
jgi:hypothetical protein